MKKLCIESHLGFGKINYIHQMYQNYSVKTIQGSCLTMETMVQSFCSLEPNQILFIDEIDRIDSSLYIHLVKFINNCSNIIIGGKTPKNIYSLSKEDLINSYWFNDYKKFNDLFEIKSFN